jgi:3-oxoacyl-[acyl-carrier-protein] synthase-3
MKMLFENKKITGILTVIPKNELLFDEEIPNYNFSAANSMKLKKIMGYDRHRIVNENACVSDLCVHGLNYLFENRLLAPEEIDALILVTQTPDYFMPPTSNIIQGALGLNNDILCLDINQGCAGFILGLLQAFTLLGNPAFNKVVLMNADILSRKVSTKDRNSYPLVGDAASISIIENCNESGMVYTNIKMDGIRGNALMIPAGGLRMPANAETARMEEDEGKNVRSKEHLIMEGRSVFTFVQTEVPRLIDELLEYAAIDKDEIEYFLFHQPNRFMLQKLADSMSIDYCKMPNNIVGKFGNSSGVTVPVNITYNLGSKLVDGTYSVCLAGFGSGLTWGAMLLKLGRMSFCQMIEY